MPGSAKERSVLLLPLEARGGMPAVLGRHEVAVSNSGRRRLQPWGGRRPEGEAHGQGPQPILGLVGLVDIWTMIGTTGEKFS